MLIRLNKRHADTALYIIVHVPMVHHQNCPWLDGWWPLTSMLAVNRACNYWQSVAGILPLLVDVPRFPTATEANLRAAEQFVLILSKWAAEALVLTLEIVSNWFIRDEAVYLVACNSIGGDVSALCNRADRSAKTSVISALIRAHV